MLSKLTTRHKEILTGLCGLTIALGLLAWGEVLVDRVQQSVFFGALRSPEMQTTLSIEVKRAYYIQESTGLRLAVPGGRFYNIQFNSLGFRGPELEEDNNDKTIRIAFLGSSITLDKRSFPEETSWPALTTQKLEEAFPDCRFTYQNTGITGLSSRQQVPFYKEMLNRFRPDIAVVMTDDRLITLRELATKSGMRKTPDTFSFTRKQLLAQYEKDLLELLETIRQHGAIPVVLSFGQKLQENQSPAEQDRFARGAAAFMPFMSRENLLRSAKWYNDANREIAETQQVTYIEWHKRVPGVGRYFHDSRHLSSTGSALLAEILADEIQRSKIFSRAISTRFGCSSRIRDH